MPSTCDRCQREKWITIMSVMNEDGVCLDCLKEERKHPRYKEAKRREALEVMEGNYDYPGLFAGQKYPFEEIPDVSENIPWEKANSAMI